MLRRSLEDTILERWLNKLRKITNDQIKEIQNAYLSSINIKDTAKMLGINESALIKRVYRAGFTFKQFKTREL